MQLYRGWLVVIACGIIATFSWGLGFYGLGVYLHALHRLHGWSTGLISVAVTVYYALSAVCLVFVGGLIDRHGPRGVLAYGVVTMAGAVGLLGLITTPWHLFAVYLVLATAWACLSLTGISSTLLPWFGRRQGLAMTLALTGASVGGMVLVPIMVALVQRHGFQVATATVGGACSSSGYRWSCSWSAAGPPRPRSRPSSRETARRPHRAKARVNRANGRDTRSCACRCCGR